MAFILNDLAVLATDWMIDKIINYLYETFCNINIKSEFYRRITRIEVDN